MTNRVSWGGPEPTGPKNQITQGHRGTITKRHKDGPNGTSRHMDVRWDDGPTTTEDAWMLDPAPED